MSQAELLRVLAAALEQLQIRWMLVGSHASSVYGEARSTHDIDVVFDFPDHLRPALMSRFSGDRYYLSDTALRERRMANLIDTKTGDKVDLFFLRDERARQQLERRRRITWLGQDIYVASPEDTIVSKLQWNREIGGSERQINDVRNIVSNHGNRLDRELLFRLLAESELTEVWQSELADDAPDV